MARPPGLPNKRTQEFTERYEFIAGERGFDLIETLVEIAQNEPDVGHRIKAATVLADRLYAKRKAVTMEVQEPLTITLVDEEYRRIENEKTEELLK